ncbi:MAG: barstar family protein [Mycobacteriales bacterium]
MSTGRRRLRPGLRTVGGRRSVQDAVEAARERGMEPHVAGPAASKRELLDAVADALGFPGWTGRNWDALADALADLSWLPTGPHVLVWEAPERLRDADPGAHSTALEVLREAAQRSAASARPLTVLLLPGGSAD